MAANVVVRFYPGVWDNLMRGPNGFVVPRIRAVVRAGEAAAKSRAPVDSGRMRAQITSDVDVRGNTIVGQIRSPAKYSMFVLRGTGIYGPRGRVITPKNGRYLVFKGKGGHGPVRRGRKRRPGAGGLVFARFVRGTPKNPFLTDALEAVSPWPVRIYEPPRPALP